MNHRTGARTTGIVGLPHVLVGTTIALPWLWLCWKYWDFYPLWDAAIYYESTLAAAKTTLNPLAYNIAGHPTMGYLWPLGVLIRVLGGSYRVVLAYNAVLGWLMSMAVADIAIRLQKGERHRLDLALVVGSVMYCPVVVASIVQLTPDFGVLVFLTLSWRAFMRDRRLFAACWGVLAALSKESGVLLFAVEIAAYVLIFGLRAPNLASRKRNAMYRQSPLILAPIAGLAIAQVMVTPEGNVGHWQNVDLMSVVRQFMTISFLDNVLPASLATIFVLNCMWIPALALIAASGYWFVRSVVVAQPSHASRDPAFEFAVVTFLLDLLLLTRFRTFTNVRYYLPVFPWIVLLAARGLLAIRLPRLVRLVGQGVTLVAVGLSNFRSFDPVSDDLFGTIRFGTHRLFYITSLTGECCGLGRDQLVYNLEFAELDQLLREALPFVLAGTDHAIAIHPEADWRLFDTVDPITLRRATPRAGSFKVPYTHTWAVGAARVKPERIYYLAMPNMRDSAELTRYANWYSIDWCHRRFDHDGYHLDVHELILKH
jgi:hypothetical protein